MLRGELGGSGRGCGVDMGSREGLGGAVSSETPPESTPQRGLLTTWGVQIPQDGGGGRNTPSGILLLLEPATGACIEHGLTLISRAHLAGAIGHPLVPTAGAAPLHQGSLEVGSRLLPPPRGLQAVELDGAADGFTLKIGAGEGEAAAGAADGALGARPGQD